MSKRVCKAKGTFNPEKAAVHIQQYMEEHDLNISGLALECKLNRRVISPLCKGEDKAYNMDTFNQIALCLGGIRDYWLGMTDSNNIEQRQKELDNLRDLQETERAMDFAIEELERLEAEKIRIRKDFFNLLGYRYENITNTPAAEFVPDPHPHILTGYQDKEKHAFTDEQFSDLLQTLKGTVDFACYQADKSKSSQATQQIEKGGTSRV